MLALTGLLRLAVARALLLLKALALLALLVGEFLTALCAAAVALRILRFVAEIALVVEGAVGVLQGAVHRAVQRAVLLLAAAALTHLDLHVLHLVEHALHVIQKLPRLIACAGFGKVAQGLQHAREFVIAQRLWATAAAHLLAAIGHATIAQGLSHLCGQIVLDGLFVHVHQAPDLFFRRATTQRFFQRTASGFQRGSRIRQRAVFGAQRDIPQQSLGFLGFGAVVGCFDQAPRIAQAHENHRILEIVISAPGDRIERHHRALHALRRPLQPRSRRQRDGVVAIADDRGEIVRAFGCVVLLPVAQQDLPRFLRHAGVGLEEDLVGQAIGEGLAFGCLSRRIGDAQLHHQVEPSPAVAHEVLAVIAFLFGGGEGRGLDDDRVLDDAGRRRCIGADFHQFELLDAVVVAHRVFEFGAVAVAHLGRLDEGNGRRRIVDHGEGKTRALAPEVHRDARLLAHDNARLIGAVDAGFRLQRCVRRIGGHHADLRAAGADDADGDFRSFG